MVSHLLCRKSTWVRNGNEHNVHGLGMEMCIMCMD